MGFITAKQAQELSGTSIEDLVNEEVSKACVLIAQAANKKLRSVKLYGDVWSSQGYLSTVGHKLSVNKLKELGFTVRYVYEDGQFANMYTEVQW